MHLLSLLADERPTLFCLSELHLKSNNNWRIRGYNFIALTSNTQNIGSGIFVHESVPFQIDINVNIDLIRLKQVEASAVKLKFANTIFSVVNIYILSSPVAKTINCFRVRGIK